MSTSDRPFSTRVVLEAGRADRQYWQDLWRYRELLLILAWRDVSVRYKQTVVGIAWAFIRPFLTTVVFTVVLGHLAKVQADTPVPNALVVIAGCCRGRCLLRCWVMPQTA
jgi:lipopolysaccharide transport system permease protein